MNNSAHDIAADENPQDPIGWNGTVLDPYSLDEDGEDGVDAGGEEYRRGDDEEVLEHEPDHAVGILVRGEGTENVSK